MAIKIQLKGGLGNQLFQYAFGRALAQKNSHALSLDCNWYQNIPNDITARTLLLPLLNTEPLVWSSHPLISPSSKANYLRGLLPLYPLYFDRDPFAFNEALFNKKFLGGRDYAFVGYWQSFRYFSDIRPLLVEEFRPKNLLNDHYSSYGAEISSKESVMLHIRRSDLVTLKSASTNHGVLDIQYYVDAIKKMMLLVKSPHIFVFSDDIGWAKKNLPNSLPITFIENECTEVGVIQELHLMTQCKHHIIANSSLSWWGAWLSNQDSTVKLCPDHWVKKGNVALDDLLPLNWLRMPAQLL